MFQWDLRLFHFINGLAKRWRWLDYFGVFCAVYLIWLMLAAALFFFWQIEKEINRFRYLLALFSSAAAAYLINLLIGLIFTRTRPFGVVDGVRQLMTASFLHKSFPSSHATIAFALALTVFWFDKKWGAPLLAAAVLVSWGRVFTGVHYPLDAAVGAILGGVISYVVYRIIL